MKTKISRVLRRTGLALLVLLAALSAWLLVVTPEQKASRTKINSHGFTGIAEKTTWDMKKPMLWGYYFTSERKLPLQISRWLFGFVGYRFVDLSRDENDLWWLHLECIEIHDIVTLSIRDVRLSRFAGLTLSNYDGWDVGPPK